MESEKGTLGKGTLGSEPNVRASAQRNVRASAQLQIVPLLAFLSFSTPLIFTIAEMSGSSDSFATTNATVAVQCDVHPLTVTLLQALSETKSTSLASCSFIHDVARAGKVSGVMFHSDLTTGGFEIVPPSYREAQHLKLNDSERLAFEEERDVFQSLKAAWIEELASQSTAPTATQAKNLWQTKYQPQLSAESRKTVRKIAKVWVLAARH